MYKLELKRLLKTRSTWILMASALLVTLVLCCVNIFGAYYYSYDGEFFHALDATEMRRIVTASAEGEWTPERIRDVFAQIAGVSTDFGVAVEGETNDNYEIVTGDDGSAAASIAGYTSTFLRSIPQVFDVQYTSEITPDMAAQYYDQRKAYIEEVMTLNYGPEAAETALKLDENTAEPFYYEFGFGTGSDIASTLPVSLFAVAIVCSIICAPVFASDYSTGADDIQRCTRYGCKRLGKSKLLAAMTLSTALYIVCAAVFVALTLAVYGDDKTSAQPRAGRAGADRHRHERRARAHAGCGLPQRAGHDGLHPLALRAHEEQRCRAGYSPRGRHDADLPGHPPARGRPRRLAPAPGCPAAASASARACSWTYRLANSSPSVRLPSGRPSSCSPRRL